MPIYTLLPADVRKIKKVVAKQDGIYTCNGVTANVGYGDAYL